MKIGMILALLNFSMLFVVKCDVSGFGLGAVLMQEGRLIAYFSKALQGGNLGEMWKWVKSVFYWPEVTS